MPITIETARSYLDAGLSVLLTVAPPNNLVLRVPCRSHYSGLWKNIPHCLTQIQMGLAGRLREYDKELYKLRHFVENAFMILKRWRGVATRYAKNTASFLAAVQIRCIAAWVF